MGDVFVQGEVLIKKDTEKFEIAKFIGVCSTYLRLDTSTNGLKQVYTSPQAIYLKTYFLKNVYLNIIYNF
jgi:hypothetical protein